jgi:uncharacterized protein (DUF2062 family)
MFGRRNPLPTHHRVWSFVWPKAGWRRATRYMAHRVRRLPGTPYRIAAGIACGAAVSFTPFIGLHFISAALLALLLRGNIVASAIGTAVGNPWTFAIIWPTTYGFGRWLLGESTAAAQTQDPDFIRLFSGLVRASLEFDLVHIIDHVWPVLWPMTVGGIPSGVVVWIAVFWLVRGAVAEYQHARHRGMRRKVRARLARREAMARTERIRSAAAGRQQEEA